MKADTKIFGCIADPINHVKAPTLFTKIFQEKKVNAIMIPINVSGDNLEIFFFWD
jgi:shikimate 5-dehydrogenase